MAPSLVESPSELNQLFRDISSKFSPAESEDVVKSSKRIYGEQFKSLGNQDLLSCLDRLCKFGYISSKKLTLIKEFIATRSNNEHDINKSVEDFETSHPSQPEPEKELHGRIEEFKEITEKLKMKPFVVNLYGSAGVGKTTLARNICDKWAGEKYVFDLREAKDMTDVYLNIMGKLDLNIQNVRFDMSTVVGRIHDLLNVTSEGPPVLLLLDNVDQFTEGKGKEGKNLRTKFLYFLGKLSEFDGKKGSLNVLLTSRTQLNDSEKVSDFKLQPLTNIFSEKILLPTETFHVEAQQKKKLLDICKGVPLLLKGTAAILKQMRKSPSDLIDEIEMNSKEEAGVPVKSKYEEGTEEKPFNSEEAGIDGEQMSVIREMFDTLPSDILRVSAVSVSLFHGPFTASTAAKILSVSMSEAVAQLEGLVTNEIIHVVDEVAKQLMYDIHPPLRKYAESIKNDAMFYESYTEAKGRFCEHFMSKMKQIAGLIETSYIRAFNEFKRDRPNFEFAIDIALLPEYFSVPAGYHESALIVSLFDAMFTGKKQTELFHSWAEMCKDDGNLGSLFRALLRCWEARLVLEAEGTHKAFDVLQKASSSLKQVQDQSTEYFKLTKGHFLYTEGVLYCQNRDYKKAAEFLKSSLDLLEEPLKLDTNLARCYNALGNCYLGLSRPEKALEFYNKALKMREELSGSDYHYDMPVYKNQIGKVHEDKGEYDEAVKCYKDALELLEELKCLGYEDEALFRSNLANVYVCQEKYKEAEEEANKAVKIRLKILGNHPDTVRSIFQLGIIQANLKAHDKGFQFFRKAWEMEKSLGAGNKSEHWRYLLEIFKDFLDLYNFPGNEEGEVFREDALKFCEKFWKEEKVSPQFSFTAYNKEIIDTILFLLDLFPSTYGETEENERGRRNEYEREALWFYDGMQKATEEDFNDKFDQTRDNKLLNEMLRDRTEFLNKLIELCDRHDEHEKRLKHRRAKLMVLEGVLLRPNFVGEKKQDRLSLKSAVEQLYEEVGQQESIKGFQQRLLATWQQQWEEGKGEEESTEKMMARWRIIKGILQLCKDLNMEQLKKQYGKEASSFGKRMLEKRRSEMESVEMKALLGEMKGVASWIGGREDATPRKKTESEDVLSELVAELAGEQVIGTASQETIEGRSGEGAEYGNETGAKGDEEEVTEVEFGEVMKGGSTGEFNGKSSVVFRGLVTSEGANWAVKQGGVLLMFPPDAVFEPTPIVVRSWKSSVRSPPLQGREAIISNVIEISSMDGKGLKFNAKVKLSLSHNATDTRGHEPVIKMLIGKESNEWVDVNGTMDLRCRQDIKDDYSSQMEIPDRFFPIAQADITECSTYAVVCRPKSSPTYTVTSSSGSFGQPNYTGATVTDPDNDVAFKAKLPLKLKESATDGRSASFMRGPLRVTLVGDEWGSSKGGLSTLNRELAKNLARQPGVEVTILLPHYSEREKQEANDCRVSLATPEPMPGFDSIRGLSFPKEDHDIDVVIGHGQKLGAPAQVIAKQRKCKRVHVVHTASEELALFKDGKTALTKGEEKVRTEIDLCKEVDFVVAIGPKLKSAVSANLRWYGRDEDVINITPGIFWEFAKLEKASQEREQFRILVFGRGDSEDFKLKGYDIAAEAVAGLEDKSYLLIFVGAPDGKEKEVKDEFLKCGIPSSQLIVRGFVESRDALKRFFYEADLAVMPSRTEGFGLTVLEALSAGLPILVSDNSGLGKAIKTIPFGRAFLVDSDNAEEWGKAISRLRQTPRKYRLKEACFLREAYDKKYKWETQCEKLVKKMRACLAVEEGMGTGSHGGSDEQVDVESENETETESENDTDGEKEDVEVHEQVAELAGEEAMEAESHGGSEEEIKEESDDQTETQGADTEGQNYTEEESRGVVTSEGTNWAIEKIGVHLMFPPDAVSEPTPIMVQRWKYSACSPPLEEHEAITSNVIELSSMDSQGVKFNTKVKLSLSHSATNLRGYELVIKQLTDKETNKWEEVDGTKDIRSLEAVAEVEDNYPSDMEMPDFFFPVAQADITEYSTYAVVCRLKTSPTYSITSKGGSFSHPDYPGVTVTIPENAVAPSAEFPLELKVQEVSNEEFEEEGVFLGPVLRINCSQGVQFLKPVTIRLPISLREQQDLNLSPICGSTCDVNVLFLKSDDKQKTWIDITDDLVNPPSVDGKFISFEVERFSRYSHFVKRRNKISRFSGQRVIEFLNRSISVQPRLAVFFAYFRPDLSTILRVMCCPAHLKGEQIKKLKREGIRRPIYSNSKEDMTPGYDKAFVLVSGGIRLHEEEDMDGIYLRFLEHDSDDAEVEVDFFPGENVARVRFYNTLKHREPPLCRLHLKTPARGTDYSDFEERCRQPNVKKGIPTDDELEDLSEKIPDHWKKLGRRLEFSEAELQGFNCHDEKAYAMLMAWKQREGSAATYRVLNKALCHIRVKRRDLAQQFCCY